MRRYSGTRVNVYPPLPVSRSRTACLLSTLLLGGCGGSGHGDEEKQITVPSYNGYPAITISVTTGTPAQCRHEAQVFSRNAVAFLAPFPSDSDNYLVLARLQFLEFKAHSCDVEILRDAFARRATPKQRQAVVSRIEFIFLGDTGRELTGP